MRVALLVPVCSRNKQWTSLGECYLFTHLLPSFRATQSPDVSYSIYAGVDDDDTFFLDRIDELRAHGVIPVIVSGCQHAPAWVWNHLFARAVADGHDYFFQIGDDVVLKTPGWTERFVRILQSKGNIGCVGPCNPINYQQRVASGKLIVIENAFVHKTHYDLFQTFFHPSIRNWYCDDWLTQVYGGITCLDMEIENGCVDNRYAIEHRDIAELVRVSKRRLYKGCFSFCLFGPYSDKYYAGFRENVEIVHREFPGWDIYVYVSPEAEAFASTISGIHVVPTHRDGRINTVYRFLPIADNQYDVVCIRDTDSRIHTRDRWCIDTFLESEDRVYTIRDHAYHKYRIMCGLWGVKRGDYLDKKALHDFCDGHADASYTTDVQFLDGHLRISSMVVYSYRPDGLFNNPNEKVQVIDCPLSDGDFCGNVVLYREDGTTYTEFTQT